MVFSILLYTTYYYVTNLQGDVIAILNTAGTAVVQYTYDAWGNILTTSGTMASTLGEVNPLTYRSYVYDHETGLYYLQSRYYDPELGRFLNADAFASTGQGILGNNMFAYCGNNPVNKVDYSGRLWAEIFAIAIAVACAVLLTSCDSSSSSGPYSGQANCYAYALGLEYDPRTNKPFKKKPDPGVFSGEPLDRYDLYSAPFVVKETIENKIDADADALGLRFYEIPNLEYEVPEGCWLIAIAYNPSPSGSDYHFWKQGSDGLWSHKPGATPIMYVDYSGDPIYDPAVCDRGGYEVFLGYYVIGPK